MLTLQFVPYHEIGTINSAKKISKLLKLVKEEKIILLEGKLKGEEKTELIKKTMEEIDSKFKGIEIEDIESQDDKDAAFIQKIKTFFINILLGNRLGFTIIGPASIIKEIKKDPDKIQLLTQEADKRKRVKN